MDYLGRIYSNQGKHAEAEALWTEVLATRRRVLGPEHPDTLVSMNNLAYIYRLEHKNAQAEELNLQTLQIRRRALGPEHPYTALSMSNLASTYYEEGKYAQAEEVNYKALDILNRVMGSSYLTARSVHGLATDYSAEGKDAQADALYRRFLKSYPTNPDLLDEFAWYLVAVPDRRRRRPEEALRLSRQAVQESPSKNGYYNTLGLAEYRNGHWDEAITALKRSIELDAGNDPTDYFFLAMAHWRRGDKSDAEQFFQHGVDSASKDAPSQSEWRMFWGEAAEVLGKAGPVPTRFEAQSEPGRVMEVLKHAAAAGQLTVETLQKSPDLAPLRGRTDFQALIRVIAPVAH
jgi:Tfp pilus assembly protein PilF